MPHPVPQPSDSAAVLVIVLFIAGLCVRYWGTAIKVLAIIIIALSVLGLITGLHSLQHTTG